jgi:hypothetical protein
MTSEAFLNQEQTMHDEDLPDDDYEDDDLGNIGDEECPECAANRCVPAAGYPFVNIGSNHWCYCQVHRTMWWIGANLFSSWKEQTEAQQRQIYADLELETFREVDPDDHVPGCRAEEVKQELAGQTHFSFAERPNLAEVSRERVQQLIDRENQREAELN